MRHLLSISLLVLTISTNVRATDKTICGSNDEREPSKNEKVGRLVGFSEGSMGICTVTLIGRSCVISAGHCFTGKKKYIVEFNTKPSKDGQIVLSQDEDIYTITGRSLSGEFTGVGNDYAVFRLNKNRLTKKYPGDAQGHYDISFEIPQRGDTIRVTGYGTDKEQGTRDSAQQSDIGPLTKIDAKQAIIYHRIDTMGGNSGAAIISEHNDRIVGIHTNGGCDMPNNQSKANKGTSIALNKKLKAAIKSCLAAEAELD